jgi:hypothetical protein
MIDPPTLAPEVLLAVPRCEFLYEAIAEIGPMVPLGMFPRGERRIIDILGGRFEGPGLSGVILPGGADRQWVRRDGVTELDALYEMRTHDGVILSVNNRVTIDTAAGTRLSKIAIEAPEGGYAWLNRLVVVGTLTPLGPARPGVLIRAFKLVG